jgi:hypothetical protein
LSNESVSFSPRFVIVPARTKYREQPTLFASAPSSCDFSQLRFFAVRGAGSRYERSRFFITRKLLPLFHQADLLQNWAFDFTEAYLFRDPSPPIDVLFSRR